jgi:hypothetical protein
MGARGVGLPWGPGHGTLCWYWPARVFLSRESTSSPTDASSCSPSDAHATCAREIRKVSRAAVRELQNAFRKIDLRPFEGCIEAPADSFSDLLAFYDQGQESVVFTAGQFAQLRELEDTIDRTLQTSALIQATRCKASANVEGPDTRGDGWYNQSMIPRVA